MDILDILGTAGGRRRILTTWPPGGERGMELSHPEGINTVLAKATVEQTKPLTSTHWDSLGVLDKQIFRCFVKQVDNIIYP